MRANCDPSRAERLFPAQLGPLRTALIRGFSQYFCNESALTGPYGSYDNTGYHLIRRTLILKTATKPIFVLLIPELLQSKQLQIYGDKDKVNSC